MWIRNLFLYPRDTVLVTFLFARRSTSSSCVDDCVKSRLKEGRRFGNLIPQTTARKDERRDNKTGNNVATGGGQSATVWNFMSRPGPLIIREHANERNSFLFHCELPATRCYTTRTNLHYATRFCYANGDACPRRGGWILTRCSAAVVLNNAVNSGHTDRRKYSFDEKLPIFQLLFKLLELYNKILNSLFNLVQLTKLCLFLIVFGQIIVQQQSFLIHVL